MAIKVTTVGVGVRFIAPALPRKTARTAKRKPLRLKGFDYSSVGMYFVTICTRERECLFGEIIEASMQLNGFGRVVEACWKDLPTHFGRIAIDAAVVMPNHVHGIVCVEEQEPGAMNRAPTLGEIVRNFKARCARAWRREQEDCRLSSLWQRGYYEHVIRNEADLTRVREYIANNPLRWALDRENPACSVSH